MKRVDLIKTEHNVKIGDNCPRIEPNVFDDCILYEDGIPIGFYIKKMPEKMCKLADVANNELRSKNVPKSKMKRSSGFRSKENEVLQYSTIIGSVPPKPHMRRPYATISSVHNVKTAQNFIKAMLLLAKEAQVLIKEILPNQYESQMEVFSNINPKWKFGDMFTSSISNFNISAPFHRDAGNVEDTVNVIITKRMNSKGGCLNVPDYGATFEQADNSILVYPAWKNIHGVTPIETTFDGGYRNSLVFYPLNAFVGLK